MTTRKKNLLIFLLFIFLKSQILAQAYENNIIYKLNNEIITSLDIQNEKKYLLALNPKLADLKNSEILEISKNQL